MELPNVPSLPNVSSPIQFIREVISELKKVNWPTRAETIKLTVVVIAISVIVAAYIGGLDALFLRIETVILKR